MTLVLLLGGARSGKSDLAVRLAAAQPRPVTLIATAEAGDADMATRIARHRAERPAEWRTVETPIELAAAIAAAPPGACLVVDDLTLWVANLLGAGDLEARTAAAIAAAAARRAELTIVVSNEVGMGIVPDNGLARSYRDELGRVNAAWAVAADRSYLLVAGRLLALEPAGSLIAEYGG